MINTLFQAYDYIYSHIFTDKEKLLQPAFRLERTRWILKQLGNPQAKIKTVHIAGTSGKGSTTFITSTILKSQGFKVGMFTSPHLLDIRERIQINNKLISKAKFIKYLNTIIPTIEKTSKSIWHQPMFFEILTVLAFYIFEKERVDYSVIETGLGGLYDCTNTISNENKISILTKLGFDHTEILGNTLEEIALQKAGIILPNSTVFSAEQETSATEIIQHISQKNNSSLEIINQIPNKNIAIDENGTTFKYKGEAVKIGLTGTHQANNCTLAINACKYMLDRDKHPIRKRDFFNSISKLRFNGRFEIIKKDKTRIILDGAHNPQKMKSLIDTLKIVYPNQTFDFLIAFKEGKDCLPMIAMIKKIAKKIYLTQFKIDKLKSINPITILSQIEKSSQKNIEIIEDPSHIFQKWDKKSHLVITGSFFLISNLYKTVKDL